MHIRSIRLGSALAAGLFIAACGGNDKAPLHALDVDQPAGWDDDIALKVAEDINPDPDIVEINLEAKITNIEIVPGHPTPVWAYNGSLPGPLIRAKVGDKVIVHFKNSLPESTSIHWHGLRLPNNMDGVPGITQAPIEPNAEFRYEFTARDAGTFWYHPHINSAAQVGWGLYGAVVVEDPADPKAFGDDLVILLSDQRRRGRPVSTRGQRRRVRRSVRPRGTHPARQREGAPARQGSGR